jgi:predicted dehydrogenase
MRQALVKKGKVWAAEVPAPMVSPGTVLIKVVTSCISAGTEVAVVQESQKSLIQKALSQPEKLKKAWHMAQSEGLDRLWRKLREKQEASAPIGYSLAGVVLAVGEGVRDFQPGDRVAAAGAGIAHHAEYVEVPDNLVVALPASIGFAEGSSVALGAIALHAVRRANLKLGEWGVVLGTGIIGLLCVQILKASGVRVVASDINTQRLQIAAALGAEYTLSVSETDIVAAVQHITGGHGADAVLFTAATASSTPLAQSFKMARKKGRVVLVGVSGMQIAREDMYAKEIDFMISTSYGPGRYDDRYEQNGVDYPYAYVRWTERRNMQEYLRLLAVGVVRLDKLIHGSYPLAQVEAAFAALQDGTAQKPLMLLVHYGEPDMTQLVNCRNHERKVMVNSRPVASDKIKVALVGAGNFATTMHLPNLRDLSAHYQLHAVMDACGVKARAAAEAYGAAYATTSYQEILHDNQVDLLLIATRHDSHAQLTLQALQAGKHVLVEKPLAVRLEELNKIKEFYSYGTANKPLLMVAYNRRFSCYAQEIKKHVAQRLGPLFITYRMNAGYIASEHWVHEHGGRIVGEACHILDLFAFWIGAPITSLFWDNLSPAMGKFQAVDNKAIVLKYGDGSVATLHYFAVGSPQLSKEYVELHFDGKSVVMDNYQSLQGYDVKLADIATTRSDKGHREELLALARVLKGKEVAWPIPFDVLLETTEATFAIAGVTSFSEQQ